MNPDFQRVAIVNRGEAAMRFINAVREFNQEHGTALRTVALYTDPDRRAMFVREADEAYSLGPATVSSGDGERKVGYLDYARLETALAGAGVDAVWTGWGFVSEHAGFAELCDRLGIVFIGPPPDAMRRLSDKVAAKTLAAEAGVPVVPWSGASVAGPAEAAEAAAALGYPVTAFLTLEIRQSAEQGGHEAVGAHLAAIVEVLEAHTTSGAGDMLVRVVARDNADLQRVIDRVLATPAITRCTTVIALATQVPHRVLPLAVRPDPPGGSLPCVAQARRAGGR